MQYRAGGQAGLGGVARPRHCRSDPSGGFYRLCRRSVLMRGLMNLQGRELLPLALHTRRRHHPARNHLPPNLWLQPDHQEVREVRLALLLALPGMTPQATM